MIGQDSEQGLAAVSDDRLLLKTQLCRKLADLIEILAPDDRPGLGAGPGGGQRRQTAAEDSAVQEAGRLDRDISTRYMHLS
ncbi:Sanna [Operophtera brumata]|uniref:Sanna n=1 Tax=Operophtera brumata TaxID=104452 RepID=A0A0L7L1B8_OPEBR|nr:Sanna [Operophtera brumata]